MCSFNRKSLILTRAIFLLCCLCDKFRVHHLSPPWLDNNNLANKQTQSFIQNHKQTYKRYNCNFNLLENHFHDNHRLYIFKTTLKLPFFLAFSTDNTNKNINEDTIRWSTAIGGRISKSVKIHTFYNIMTRIFEMNNSNGMVCGCDGNGVKVILMSYGILMFIVCSV